MSKDNTQKGIEGLARYGVEADPVLVKKIVNYLGIALRVGRDAALVSCADESELARVKKSLLRKKLGLTDESAIDAGIAVVCEKMKGDRQKSRVLFYYFLVKHFGGESAFGL